MRIFWNFRTNLKSLESYHQYTDLESFKIHNWDFYLALPLWLLENNYFDEVITWRLTTTNRPDIIFQLPNGNKFIQRWVFGLNEVFSYPKPQMSFFRGGFVEYDQVTKSRPNYFGKKIYLAAGQRLNAQWGGKYDIFLMEDDKDLKDNNGTIPFYKTVNPNIFYPNKSDTSKEYDIIWPCNFTQLRYKNQEFFIKQISQSKQLKMLRILHCGNKPEIGKKLCKQYNVNNIEFSGHKTREQLNSLYAKCKVGLNLSNRLDGCPRVSTECLMTGTPLVIHENTRLLSYYKQAGVIEANEFNLESQLLHAIKYYDKYEKELMGVINDDLSFDKINQKNIELWNR